MNESMDDQEMTLCFPDREKTCFACCPPIRPPGYEHIQYENMVKRILRENTNAYLGGMQKSRAITGFSCWGLGYLDHSYRLIGCLLHPAQNSGLDLRDKVQYGDKCSREICPEAGVFLELDRDARKFWLGLTRGLEAFRYSSRRHNPLFQLLNWGSAILRRIASEARETVISRDTFFTDFPFFQSAVNPRAHAYILRRILERESTVILKSISFRKSYDEIAAHISDEVRAHQRNEKDEPYVHRLDMDGDFLALLRLEGRIGRMNGTSAGNLKRRIDEMIDQIAI
jgi:hypothetical protein